MSQMRFVARASRRAASTVVLTFYRAATAGSALHDDVFERGSGHLPTEPPCISMRTDTYKSPTITQIKVSLALPAANLKLH
jgi:hypothetical protein